MTRLLLFVAIALLAGACGKPDPEAEAQVLLSEAREQLAARHYDEARATLASIGRLHRMAVNARRAALVLRDSVNMLAAIDSLASCGDGQREELERRVEFYRRKFEFNNKE